MWQSTALSHRKALIPLEEEGKKCRLLTSIVAHRKSLEGRCPNVLVVLLTYCCLVDPVLSIFVQILKGANAD